MFALKMKQSILCVIFILLAIISISSGRPTENLTRHKRQSDQRVAELETLLALQKYRHHRLRAERKGSQAGYGVIDFNTIGRRKKSLRFSPGVEDSSVITGKLQRVALIQAAKRLNEEHESVDKETVNEHELLPMKSVLPNESGRVPRVKPVLEEFIVNK